MKRLLTLWLLIGLRLPLAHAQLDPATKTQVNQAAFQLTKVTVEFVATDTKTYGYRKLTFCATCTDYPSLVQFTIDNKLTKADELVRDAQKQVQTLTTPTATADQILTGLQTYLQNRVVGGDKQSRVSLPSYKTYRAKVTDILAKAGVAPNPGDEAEPTADDGLATNPADTLETDMLLADKPTVTKADSGLFSYGGLALLLSLIDLAGLILLWRQKGETDRKKVQPDNLVAEMSGRLLKLEQERKELITRLARLEKVIATPPERPAAGSPSRPADSALPRSAPAPITPRPASPTQTIQPRTPSPDPASTTQPQPVSQSAAPSNQFRQRDTILYGRTADLGDGFSVGSLMNTPDRDTVFQIEIRTDSQAVYRVTEEPGAQQLALSDPYSYLADACEYLAKPMPNARIRTDQPGQLALQGDKWKILEKAKISFY